MCVKVDGQLTCEELESCEGVGVPQFTNGRFKDELAQGESAKARKVESGEGQSIRCANMFATVQGERVEGLLSQDSGEKHVPEIAPVRGKSLWVRCADEEHRWMQALQGCEEDLESMRFKG